MSCLCKNTSRYYTPCGCGCGHTCGCYCVNTTSTTTTIAPCINGEVCEEAIDPNCIIYCGRDLPCYGIKTGDTAADILNVILALLTDCTTTTTTTIAPTSTSTSTSTSTTSTSTSTTIIPTSTSTTTIIPTSTSTTTIIPTSTSTTTIIPTSTSTTTIIPTSTSTTTIIPTSTSTTTIIPTSTSTTTIIPTSTSTTTILPTSTSTTTILPTSTSTTTILPTSTTTTTILPTTTTTTTILPTTTTTTTIIPTSTSTTTIIPTSTSTSTTTTILPTSTSTTTIIPTSTTTTTILPTTTTTTTVLPTTTTTTTILPTSTSTTTIPIVPACDTEVFPTSQCLNLNGGFDYNLDNWNILGSNATWSSVMGGSCALESTSPSAGVSIFQNILQPGSTYRIEFDVLKVASQGCNPTLIYLDVFAGTAVNSLITQNLTSGTVHIDMTMTCVGNNEFKITGYNPICSGGPFLFIDNVCVTEINITAQCDINLFIIDQTCDPCADETCLIRVNPTPLALPINYQIAKVSSPLYSINGTKFRTSGSNPNTVLNGENSVLQTLNTGIWINSAGNTTDGPFNRCAIQIVNPDPGQTVNTYYGHKFPISCIDPTLSGKTICMGVAGGDFAIQFFYEGVGNYSAMYRYFITNLPGNGWIIPSDKTQCWNVYEVQLPVGAVYAYMTFFGTDQPFGFEIYDQPMSTLANATTVQDLNIIYSSLDIDTLQIKVTNTYNLNQQQSGQPECPSGFYYEPCTNSCVAILNCPNSAECSLPCTPGPLPNPRFPTTYYGNIQMSYTYTGPTLLDYIPTISCIDIIDVPGSIFLGYNPGAFTYTILFSEPVNDIELLGSAGGAYNNPGEYEEFTFTTNAGDPTLISCENGCLSYVQDNKFYTSSTNFSTAGALWFKVNAPSAFTQLTITGLGGLAGVIFGICSKDVGTLFEQYPLIYDVKSIYTIYDVVGAPPTPPSPEPDMFSIYTNYDV